MLRDSFIGIAVYQKIENVRKRQILRLPLNLTPLL